VIIEAIGRPETYRAAVEEVSFAGRVVYIGYARTRQLRDAAVCAEELDIRGSRNAAARGLKEVIRMFEQKRFPTARHQRDRAVTSAGDPARVEREPAAYTKIMISFD